MSTEASTLSPPSVRDLLEAGVHFGHETKRWNPKMKPFIFGARRGVYIIDLEQTEDLFRKALDFVQGVAARGGKVLFVGTKRQAKEVVEAEAERCGMHYVSQRWLGGTLSNWRTLYRSIRQLRQLDQMGEQQKEYEGLTKKERLQLTKKRERMAKLLEGIKGLDEPPDVLFIVDPRKERIAVLEANRMRIPVIAICDTNCDPEPIQHVIPGNDDAIRSIRLFVSKMADAVLAGRSLTRQAEPEAAAAPKPAAPSVSRVVSKAVPEAPAKEAKLQPAVPKAEPAPPAETPAAPPAAESAPAAEAPAAPEPAAEPAPETTPEPAPDTEKGAAGDDETKTS